MSYRYFVSFAHSNGRASGFGNAEITLGEPITGIADVQNARDLVERSGAQQVTILSWQLFKDAP